MQPKRPRFNPLILALALAGVLMIWSVLGTSDSSTGGSTMSYSTVVHYFENNQSQPLRWTATPASSP